MQPKISDSYCFKTLKLCIHAANHLKYLSIYNINFEIWYKNTKALLASYFGLDSEHYRNFINIKFSPKKTETDFILKRKMYVKSIEESIEVLLECIKQINPAEISFDITTDIEEFLQDAILTSPERKDIITMLNKAVEAENTLQTNEAWAREIEQNKIINIINNLIDLILSLRISK